MAFPMNESNDESEWQTIFSARVTGNAHFRFGIWEESLLRLLSNFEISQGYLYHYTSLNVAESISKGDFWLTRADDFLDKREVDHGLEMLISTIPASWGEELASSYLLFLDTLRNVLRKCYVLSLSQDHDNDYLIQTYASADGAILRLPSNINFALSTGWHAISMGDGFSLRYAKDLYDFAQGFVDYDLDSQKRISALACEAFQAISQSQLGASPEVIVEWFHFRDALLQCLILFKEPGYRNEKEYRIALILKPSAEKSFEQVREIKGRQSSYIKMRVAIPLLEQGVEIRRLTKENLGRVHIDF